MHTWRIFPVGQLPVGGGQKDKAPEPNRNKISVLDARFLLGLVQDPKRRSLSGPHDDRCTVPKTLSNPIAVTRTLCSYIFTFLFCKSVSDKLELNFTLFFSYVQVFNRVSIFLTKALIGKYCITKSTEGISHANIVLNP